MMGKYLELSAKSSFIDVANAGLPGHPVALSGLHDEAANVEVANAKTLINFMTGTWN